MEYVMNNIYYVYGLIDPRTDLPFYIGKGKDNRYEHHFRETLENTENIHKHYKIQYLQNNGYEISVIKFYENLCENEAYLLEEELIRKYGRYKIDQNGILTNICMSKQPPSNLGKKHTDETKKKMSGPNPKKALFGEKNGFYGKHHSEEVKQKLAEKAKKQFLGVKKTISHIINMRNSFTEERKEKLSNKRRELNSDISESHRTAIQNNNKIIGYNRTKNKIQMNIEAFRLAALLLSNGVTISKTAIQSNLTYYQVWDMSKRYDYFIQIIRDIENEF